LSQIVKFCHLNLSINLPNLEKFGIQEGGVWYF
jgi:hypothetical protein